MWCKVVELAWVIMYIAGSLRRDLKDAVRWLSRRYAPAMKKGEQLQQLS